MNDAFNCLNSKYNLCNNYKSVLQKDNCVFNKLQSFIIFLRTIRVDFKNLSKSQIYCFDGLIQTVTGILNAMKILSQTDYSNCEADESHNLFDNLACYSEYIMLNTYSIDINILILI